MDELSLVTILLAVTTIKRGSEIPGYQGAGEHQ